ncbi:hypothetical protein [Mycobacterium sp. URHB0021]
MAPALYQSATLNRRGRISRQGLAEHRDALMGIAWGLYSRPPSPHARQNCAPEGWLLSKPVSPWPATPADWPTDSYESNNRSMDSAIFEEGSVASGYGRLDYAARRRNLACRPPALSRLTAHTKACRTRRLISPPNPTPGDQRRP